MPLLASHARIAIAFVHHAGKPPPFRATLLRNTLLPGTAQIALGHVSEGRLLLAGSFSLGIALHRVLAVGGAS